MDTSRVITIANQKGGTGKTTLAVNLAVESARRGHHTCVIDTDPQGTALDWASRRDSIEDEGELAQVNVIRHHEHTGALEGGVPDAIDADLTIIDTKGQLDGHTVRACKAADLILIPVAPTAADLWPTGDLVTWIKKRKEVNSNRGALPRPDAAMIVWRAKVGTKNAAEADRAAGQLGLDVLDARSHDRVAWQQSIGDGVAVSEIAGTGKASDELTALTTEVLSRLSRHEDVLSQQPAG